MQQGQLQVEVLQDAVGTLQREAQSLSRTVRAYEEGIVAAIKDAATEPVEVATHQWSMLGRKLTAMEVTRHPAPLSPTSNSTTPREASHLESRAKAEARFLNCL
jgi:hypothetical protein